VEQGTLYEFAISCNRFPDEAFPMTSGKAREARERDHAGQALAYVYYDHPQAGDLTWDEARRTAANIAKLPDLLSRPRTWGR
jgi:hypothetical protein